MNNFNPGEFNKRIKFLKKTMQSGTASPKPVWTEYKSAWAKMFDFNGTDFYTSQTSETKIEVKFDCRYMAGITKDMRIQFGNDAYEIIGTPIDVDNKRKELLIYCRLVIE